MNIYKWIIIGIYFVTTLVSISRIGQRRPIITANDVIASIFVTGMVIVLVVLA